MRGDVLRDRGSGAENRRIEWIVNLRLEMRLCLFIIAFVFRDASIASLTKMIRDAIILYVPNLGMQFCCVSNLNSPLKLYDATDFVSNLAPL